MSKRLTVSGLCILLPSYTIISRTIREFDSQMKDKSDSETYTRIPTGQVRKCLRLLLQPARREIKPISIPSVFMPHTVGCDLL